MYNCKKQIWRGEGPYNVALVIESNHVSWIEQCHGCGCEVQHPDRACVLSATLSVDDTTSTEDQDEVVLFFCSSACVDQKGIPSLTDASRNWAQKARAGLVLKTRRSDESSWQDICKSSGFTSWTHAANVTDRSAEEAQTYRSTARPK
jgi:hypothetical protein